MKRFIPLLISALFCLSIFSCNSNVLNTASVSVVIPANARSAMPEDAQDLVYNFKLTTADGADISNKTASPEQAVTFENLNPGSYIMKVTAAPEDDSTNFIYEGTSDTFTLAAGEEKAVQITLKKNNTSVFADDDGIELETSLEFETLYVTTCNNEYNMANIEVNDFAVELEEKGYSYESGDTLLFYLTATPTKTITDMNYECVIDNGDNSGWNSLLGTFNANEQFEILLPINTISLENGSCTITGLLLYIKDTSYFSETLKNVEVKLKLYKKNSETDTTTCILRKGVYESQYRYEALLPISKEDNVQIEKNSNYKISLAGTSNKDATIQLSLINATNGGYEDISTSGASITYSKGSKINKSVSITTTNLANSNITEFQLHLKSPCTNTSYTDVLIIYDFPTEPFITQ